MEPEPQQQQHRGTSSQLKSLHLQRCKDRLVPFDQTPTPMPGVNVVAYLIITAIVAGLLAIACLGGGQP